MENTFVLIYIIMACALTTSMACRLDTTDEEFLLDLVGFLARQPGHSAVLVIGAEFSDCFELRIRTSQSRTRRLPDFEGLEELLKKEVGFSVVAKGLLHPSLSALLLTRGMWFLPSGAEASVRLRLDSKVFFYSIIEDVAAKIEEIYVIKGKCSKFSSGFDEKGPDL